MAAVEEVREPTSEGRETGLDENALSCSVGQRIKERRCDLELSLRDLGGKTGLSASSLSQIERGIVSPTLNSLTAIAQALKVPLFEFFVGNSQDSVVLRKGEHLGLQLPGGNVKYELVSRRGSANIAVMRARLQAGRSVYDEPQIHDQEECLYILQGRVEVQLGGERIILGPDDALHFDGNVPHLITAIGDEDVEYLICISPVVF